MSTLLQNQKMLQGCCVFFLSLAFFFEDQSVFFLDLTPLLTKIFHAVLSSANLTFLKSLHPYGTCSGCSYICPWISALVVLWVSYHEPTSQITAAWEFCCHPYASRVQATLVSFCKEQLSSTEVKTTVLVTVFPGDAKDRGHLRWRREISDQGWLGLGFCSEACKNKKGPISSSVKV